MRRFEEGSGLAAPMRRVWRAGVLLLAGLASSGCATLASSRCGDGLDRRVQDTLYFGRTTPDGTVDAAQWEAFLRDAVTPRFPDGLTVWPAAGQWRGDDGSLVREDAQVLTLLHAGDARSEAAVAAIAQDYKTRFRQEAVLRVKQGVCVSF
jgi:hypothetical protein